ncbi:MAG: ribonuclease P protein component [Armatimonadetes bacterium]|nr:ribonuclease P protein component [Armatimonadota bacterium]
MLPRAARLRKNKDFQAVYSRRHSWATPRLALYVRARAPQSGPSRFGFVISKKVARRAHDRNRLKRRLREICRRGLMPRLRPEAPVDALFVTRAPAPAAAFAELAADVDSLARQAGLLAPSGSPSVGG